MNPGVMMISHEGTKTRRIEEAGRRLKFIAPLRNERTDATSEHSGYLGLENIQSWTGKLLPSATSDTSEGDDSAGGTANVFYSGDVLFGKLRPYLAKALHADKGGVCSTELLVLKPQLDIYPRFLLYSMLSPDFVGQVDASTFGAKMPRANWEFIGSMKLPTPTYETQRLIADYLDRETARIDALVAEKEKMLALLEEKRAALISRAVTRGLDPTAPLKPSGLDWLGDIPAHWEVLQVRFVCSSLQTGPFGSQLHAEEYIDNGIPVINPAHLKDNKITPDHCISVDDETADRLSVHKLREGDVVFGRRGELGRCGVAEISHVGWLCGTGSLRVCCVRNKIDPKYLALIFNGTNAAKRLTVESVGSTMDNLNTEMLGHFRIPSPPVEEQNTIVSFIENTQTKTQELMGQLQDSINLAKERRAALITAAVTGLIDIEKMQTHPGDRHEN